MWMMPAFITVYNIYTGQYQYSIIYNIYTVEVKILSGQSY